MVAWARGQESSKGPCPSDNLNTCHQPALSPCGSLAGGRGLRVGGRGSLVSQKFLGGCQVQSAEGCGGPEPLGLPQGWSSTRWHFSGGGPCLSLWRGGGSETPGGWAYSRMVELRDSQDPGRPSASIALWGRGLGPCASREALLGAAAAGPWAFHGPLEARGPGALPALILPTSLLVCSLILPGTCYSGDRVTIW